MSLFGFISTSFELQIALNYAFDGICEEAKVIQKPTEPSLISKICEFLQPDLLKVKKYLDLFKEQDRLPVIIMIDSFNEENNHYIIDPIYQNEDEKEVLLQDGLRFQIKSIQIKQDFKGEYIQIKLRR